MLKPSARSLHLHRERLCRALILLLCCLWPLTLGGQIFRYQDEQGNWHFTDDPPERYETSIVPDIQTSRTAPEDARPGSDLTTRLQSAYNPITPIAYATLAVVSIKTNSGEGSGFFCSEKGHILTNKHVVRSQPTDDLTGSEPNLEEQAQRLQTIEANLEESRDRLRFMKQDLRGYEQLIADTGDDQTRSWAKDAHGRLSQRYRTERARISTLEKNVRTLKNDLRRSKQELGFKRRFANSEKRFEIVLKDGTELIATLVEVSDDQDLALLKLDGYRTPFLRLDPSELLSQGSRVFAIGNPLGMQDAVTSGVITRIASEHLLTDAQILPGSSGGPLIRETGEVIGINVSRKVAAGTSKYAAGFGKVIPIALAIEAFPTALASSGTRVLETAPTTHEGQIQSGNFGFERPEGIGASVGANLGSGQDASSHSAPVRLIIPDRDRILDNDIPAQDEPRSLDFPPEGSEVIPSGISLPQH